MILIYIVTTTSSLSVANITAIIVINVFWMAYQHYHNTAISQQLKTTDCLEIYCNNFTATLSSRNHLQQNTVTSTNSPSPVIQTFQTINLHKVIILDYLYWLCYEQITFNCTVFGYIMNKLRLTVQLKAKAPTVLHVTPAFNDIWTLVKRLPLPLMTFGLS